MSLCRPTIAILLFFATVSSIDRVAVSATAGSGQVDLVITDAESGAPLAASLLVTDMRGRTRRFPNSVWQGDFTYAFYQANLKLPEGTYTFEVDAGPEYRTFHGNFDVLSGAESTQEIKLERTVNLPDEGWWVTVLNAHGNPEELRVVLDGSGVDIAGWNNATERRDARRPKSFHATTEPRSRWFSSSARRGPLGSGLYLLDPDSPDFKSSEELPSEELTSLAELIQWKDDHRQGMIIADSALGIELPLWVGLDLVDGVGVLPWFLGSKAERLPREGYLVDSKTSRDQVKLAQLNHQRYFELLECGIKLPACADSQWSEITQPLATNRMMIAKSESDRDLLAGLRLGMTWVTNGPLIRVTANKEQPGHVFSASPGESVALNLALRVSTRYKLKSIEVIKNGELLLDVPLEDLRKAGGRIPAVVFEQSGWMVVRVVAEDQDVFRVCMTSPFYVDIDQTPRINATAVQQQIDRLEELLQSTAAKDLDPSLAQQALEFWKERRAQANVNVNP